MQQRGIHLYRRQLGINGGITQRSSSLGGIRCRLGLLPLRGHSVFFNHVSTRHSVRSDERTLCVPVCLWISLFLRSRGFQN